MHVWGIAPPPGHQRPRQLLAFVPARPPPIREAADAWLAARRRRRRSKGRAGSSGSQDYAMNPNTGQLIPLGPQAQRPSSAGPAEAGGGTPSALLGDAELLGTPQLSGLSSQGGSGGLDGRSDTPTGPMQTHAAMPAAAAAPGDGGNSSSDSEGSEDARVGIERGAAAAQAGDEAEVQPSSPKYDERTFFFSNPFPTLQLTQQRPASATQRQRQRQRRQRHATAAAAGGGGAAAEQTPGGQGVPPFLLPPETGGSALPMQQPRPSSRLREVAGGSEPGRAMLGGVDPMDSSQGSPPSAAEQQRQQQQQHGARPGAGPGSALLKSVLKSALKSAAGSRLGAGGGPHQEAQPPLPQRQQSQGSEGSGRDAKRVSFVADPLGDASQGGTLPGPPAQSCTPPPPAQQPPVMQQQTRPLDTPSATEAAAAVPAPAPVRLPAATPDAMLATERTQRQRQGFVSQITPPSPGLGSGGTAGATPLSQAGFKMRRCVSGKGQQLTLLSLELHADSRCGQRQGYRGCKALSLCFL